MITRAVLVTVAVLTPAWSRLAAQETAPPPLLLLQGNETLSSRALRAEIEPLLESPDGRPPDAADAEDIAYHLRELYRARGFPDATVTASLVWQNARPGLRIVVREGPRTWLGTVTLDWAPSLPERDIRAAFQWEKVGLPGLRESVFSPVTLDDGRYNLARLYEIRGYLDAAVAVESTRGEEDRVDVVVRVDEGERYEIVEPPTVEGNAALADDELLEAISLELPIEANPRLTLILKGRLVDRYRDRGYHFVDVDGERTIDRIAHRVTLSFRIDEGPLTSIRSIWVRGHERTRTSTILDRIDVRPGDTYSEEEIRRAHARLLRSGIFSSVRLDTLPVAGEPDRVTLLVEVEEKPSWDLRFLTGYGSYEQLRAGVSIERRNVFGLGHRLRGEGLVSFKGERGTARYTNPRFFHDDLVHTVKTEIERREHPSFTRTELEAASALTYRLTERIAITGGYSLRKSNVRGVSSAIPKRLRDDVLLSTIGLSTTMDYRDNVLDPTSGSTHTVSAEYATGILGSELDFTRYTASTTWLVPIWRPVVLVLHGRAGLIDRLLESDPIPIQERFFLGGESSIRSFAQDEAGPKIRGEPIGGESFLLGNAELRFPIWGDLRGTVFYDIGTVNETVRNFGGQEYSTGVGGGLRYHTPVGPFRVDLGYNPRRREKEDTWTLHFSLGYPF